MCMNRKQYHKHGQIIPLQKKGNNFDCRNLRGILLLDVAQDVSTCNLK